MAESTANRDRIEPRILNLTHDNMFVARYSDYMEEVLPGGSDYAILSPTEQPKYPVSGRLLIASGSVDEIRSMVLSRVSEYDFLVVHYMIPEWAEMISEIGERTRVVWSGFGGDYYGSDRSPNDGILAPLTAELVSQWAPKLRITGRLAHALAYYRSGRPKRLAARRADVFSAPVPDDLRVFTARYPRFRGGYAQLNYATAEESGSGGAKPTGENVLVGNSASPSNNHLDVFPRLAAAKEPGRKVLVPLSYGEPEAYRDAVLVAGKKHLGSDFMPILDFMPLEEYNGLVASCSFIVMGHRRQQGLGNILSALLSGCSVILDPVNPVYQYLSVEGIRVGSLDDLLTRTIHEFALEPQEMVENRAVVERLWGREAVLGNLRAVFLRDGSSP